VESVFEGDEFWGGISLAAASMLPHRSLRDLADKLRILRTRPSSFLDQFLVVDIPMRLPAIRDELAIWRAFLGTEIDWDS
jgi:hypothetical protein